MTISVAITVTILLTALVNIQVMNPKKESNA